MQHPNQNEKTQIEFQGQTPGQFFTQFALLFSTIL
jgi:hypothetical protein